MNAKSWSRAEVVAAISRDWNGSGIRYVVSHGLEQYPETVGRDLDIHMDVATLPLALTIAIRRLRAAGYRVTAPPQPWHWRGRWVSAFREGDNVTLDFIPCLMWGPVVLVTVPTPTHYIGPFPVNRWAEFAKRVLMHVLTGRPPSGTSEHLPMTSDVRVRCERLFGEKLTGQLLVALQLGTNDRLEALIPALRRTAAWRAVVRHPLRALGLAVPWVSRQLRPYVGRIAPILALVGPADVDRGPIMCALADRIPAPFLRVKVRQWPVGDSRGLASREVPPAGTDSNESSRHRTRAGFQAGRLLWWWVQCTAGRYLYDNKDSSALCVVCYDGCAVEVMTDPFRYGLSSRRWTRWLYRGTPKPDLVVLVHGDAAAQRRQDRTTDCEAKPELVDWLRLKGAGEVDAVVQVDAPPLEIAERIMGLVLDRFIALHLLTPSQSRDGRCPGGIGS